MYVNVIRIWTRYNLLDELKVQVRVSGSMSEYTTFSIYFPIQSVDQWEWNI